MSPLFPPTTNHLSIPRGGDWNLSASRREYLWVESCANWRSDSIKSTGRDQGAGPLKEGAERSSEVSPEEHGSGSALGLHYYPCFQLYLFEAGTPVRARTPSVSSGSRYSQTKATSTHVLCSVIELKQNWPLEHYKASETSLGLLCRLHCKPGTWSRLQTLHWDSCQQEPELQCERWALT